MSEGHGGGDDGHVSPEKHVDDLVDYITNERAKKDFVKAASDLAGSVKEDLKLQDKYDRKTEDHKAELAAAKLFFAYQKKAGRAHGEISDLGYSHWLGKARQELGMAFNQFKDAILDGDYMEAMNRLKNRSIQQADQLYISGHASYVASMTPDDRDAYGKASADKVEHIDGKKLDWKQLAHEPGAIAEYLTQTKQWKKYEASDGKGHGGGGHH